MRKEFFLGFIGLLLVFASCDRDEKLIIDDMESFKGTLFVDLEEKWEDGELVSVTHQAVLIDKETQKVYNLKAMDRQLEEYIAKSGSEVIMEATVLGDVLKPKVIDWVEPAASVLKGGGPELHSMLVVLVSDSLSSPSCTEGFLTEQLIGASNPRSAAALFNQSSYGEFVLESVAFEEVTIPEIACSHHVLNSEIRPILISRGVDVDSYNSIMYVTDNLCSYGGIASLGGRYFHNVVCSWEVVSSHELGHLLGMNHSGSWNADMSQMANFYGDPSCVMGVTYKELNAPHRIEMGWMAKNRVKSVKNSGVYNIIPLQQDASGNDKRVLKVSAGFMPYSREEFYYLSYRAPIGAIDESLRQSVSGKLSIHTWTGSAWKGNPRDSNVTRFVKALGEGEVHDDVANGVRFTNLGVVNGEMSVSVEFL